MWGEEESVAFVDVEEGVIRWDGFGGEDVAGGAGDLSVVEGGDEGGFVDDAAAGDVDEVGGGFHFGELGLADEVAGGVRQGAVDGDNLAGGEQFVEGDGGIGLVGIPAGGGVVDDFSAVGGGQLRHPAADGAHADDTVAGAAQLVVGLPPVAEGGGFGVGAVIDRLVEVNEVHRQGEQGRDGQLRHRVGAVATDVADGDAARSGGLLVYVVGARGGHADEFEVGQLVEFRLADHHFVGDDDLGPGQAGHDLLRARGPVAGELAELGEFVEFFG